MANVPRPRERTANPEELAKDRRRRLAAKALPLVVAPTDENGADLRATHGKNGRPELQAVQP